MRIIIILLSILMLQSAFAQQTIAYWAQNNNTLPAGGNGFTPQSFPQAADEGSGQLSLLNINPALTSAGAYSFVQSFAGSTVNTLPGYNAGGSLSLQGATNTSNNGASILLTTSSVGFQNLQLSYALQTTSTGFNQRVLSWSTNGVDFVEFARDQQNGNFSVRSYDLAAITALNDQAEIFIKITVLGASNATGNNRFDNIVITGTAAADVGRITVYERDFATNPFQAGWQVVTPQGNVNWTWDAGFKNVTISAFNQGQCTAADSWLISPAFDLQQQNGERLNFDIARGFNGVNPLEVYYSVSYDGSGQINPADWLFLTEINGNDFDRNNLPKRFGDFTQIDNLIGQLYIAYRYAAQAETSCSTWRVSNISITAENPIPAASFACFNPATPIHRIQGQGFQSPLQGANVQVEAVVTAVYLDDLPGSLRGFYMQEPTYRQDNNPLTSEGVFVFAEGTDISVQPGDVVRLSASVTEYFEETQLTAVTQWQRCSTGLLSTVPPTALSLPFNSFNELEALEGMLINTAANYTVTDVFNAVRFGEFSISNGQLFTPTQLVLPGEAARALAAANARNRLLVENGRTGTFRTPFILGADGLTEISASNPIRNGYQLVAGYQGVIGYGFGQYRIRPVSTPVFDSTTNPRTTAPQLPQGNLKLATFNVENLFTTLNVNGNRCGPNALTCRGATSVSELDRQLAKTVAALLAIDADLIALIEIENEVNDSTLALLVERLNQFDQRADWAYVATGHLGTDAIKPAFIFRTGSMAPQGAFAVLDELADPEFDTTRQRPALAQSFITPQGAIFTAVAVHLRAKSCSSSATGLDADSGDGQSCWNNWRSRAASALGRWIATDPTGVADPDYVIMGDFNAYAKEDPMRILEQAGFVNVADLNDGPKYSYTFMGQAGSLDHVMVSPSLLSQVLAAEAWHINADEIVNFNYREADLMANLPKPASFYNADAYRASDHDPLILSLNLLAPLSIDLQIVRVNQANRRTGAKLVQLRWQSPKQGLTLYRDNQPIQQLNRPGMVVDRFNTFAPAVEYKLCYDQTGQCSEQKQVTF